MAKSALSALSLFTDDEPPKRDIPEVDENGKEIVKDEDKNKDEEAKKAAEAEAAKKAAEAAAEEKKKKGSDESLVPTDEEVETGLPKKGEEEKKKKESQFAELRKQKDDAVAENAELKKKLEEGGGSYKPPEAIAPVLDPFKDEEDPVAALANAHKAALAEKEELKKQLEEQGGQLKAINIENDPTFRSEFLKPFNEAQEAVKLDLFRVDGAGENVHPEQFSALYSSLLSQIDKDNGEVSATKVKAAMLQFKTQYEKDTGETWDEMPRFQDVVTGLRGVVSTFSKMDGAKKSWDTEQAKLKEDADIARARDAKEKAAGQIEVRKQAVTEYLDEFDFSAHSDLGDESAVRGKLKDAYDKVESFYTDPSNLPTFPEMVRNFFYLDEMADLRSENAKMKARLEELDDDGAGGGSDKDKSKEGNGDKEEVTALGLFS